MIDTNTSLLVLFFGGIFFIFLLLVFLFSYIYLHQQKNNKYYMALQEKEAIQQKEVMMAYFEGENKERIRLAEELHDSIGAKLSGVQMAIEYIQTQMKDPEESESLSHVLQIINETITELREISHNLKITSIDVNGFQEAVVKIIEIYNFKGNCKYEYITNFDSLTAILPFEYILVGYRIISELLNNANKHSHANVVCLQTLIIEDVFQISIEDNGIGFDNDYKSSGIGFSNIKNRLTHLEGRINIDSTLQGTNIIIEIPIPKNNE